ncbi:MAG: TIGR02186 family protein [Parasphingopyxis sp.]|uniref:TIGR02186 family protein n=1 Tax=Parasphingopyxis sp. TaxID=1920299 RepID=UPI002639A0B5|nr:TIGR02186 family protein [uncultured Parasphingopyxis sp.]
MNRLRLLLLVLLTPMIMAQARPRLVPAVSDEQIEIVYSFTGAELMIYGAILYPGGRPPDDPVDIVVVLKGPQQSILMREKQQRAGIWMNAAQARFRSAPAFYAVASSRPIAEIVDERTAAIYELGIDGLQLSPASANPPAEARRFVAGLADLRQRTGLYAELPDAVEVTEGVLFNARISVPARVPVGEYTAETFLIQNGRVLTGEVRDIRIDKGGFERFVADAANRHSLLYGLFAVAISLLLGWLAGLAFRRI